LTNNEESIRAVPFTCNAELGVVVPIPTFPLGGSVLVCEYAVDENIATTKNLQTDFKVAGSW
jgi:hypothetical protein